VEDDPPVDADAPRDISDIKGLAGLSDEQLAAGGGDKTTSAAPAAEGL